MSYDTYKTPKIFHDLLKLLLQDIIELLEHHKIKYFIEGGSLLGAVRHKDIIPHDDDCDVGVMDEDYRKLKKILPELEKKSIEFVRADGRKEVIFTKVIYDNKLSKVYLPDLWGKHEDKIIGTPTIDLFRYEEYNGMIQLASSEHSERFKNCFYLTSEFYPLKKYQFGHLQVYGPDNPIPFLHRYYGPDCLNTIKIESRDQNNAQNKNYINTTFNV